MSATDKHWTFDKRVSFGHIVTTGMALVAIFASWATMERRVSINETKLEHLEVQQDKARQEMREELGDINEKLDRLIERELGR